MNAAITAHLSNAVATIGAAQVQGIFDEAYVDPYMVESVSPTFDCEQSAVPGIKHGDLLTINSVQYAVAKVKPNHGRVMLYLDRA